MEKPPKVSRTEPYRAVPCSGKAPKDAAGEVCNLCPVASVFVDVLVSVGSLRCGRIIQGPTVNKPAAVCVINANQTT